MNMELALAVIFLSAAAFTVNDVPHFVTQNYIRQCMKSRLIVTINMLPQLWWIKEPIDNSVMVTFVKKKYANKKMDDSMHDAKGTQVGNGKKHGCRKHECISNIKLQQYSYICMYDINEESEEDCNITVGYNNIKTSSPCWSSSHISVKRLGLLPRSV